ncbi:MAG: hypothetical protein Q8L78_04160 [Coxiellaceae bacterium]|nr:hypothetical protein [Coxiellaceae bacterium]
MRRGSLFVRPFQESVFVRPLLQESVCLDKNFARLFAATILNKDLDKNPDKRLAELIQQLLYLKMLTAVSDGLDRYLFKVESRKRTIKVTQEEYSKFNGWGCGI